MNILKTVLTGAFAVSAAYIFAGCSTTVKDADGNVYKTVKRGNQVWMAENLRTTKFNDGSSIPKVTDGNAWSELSTPGYCYYENSTNADSIKKYGALYNWYAVDTKGLAPKGWHVPTDDDWKILENYLVGNGYNWDESKSGNKIAKAMASMKNWNISTSAGAIGNDLTKNNKSSFSAIPSGFRCDNVKFYHQSHYGFWWSATEYDASSAWPRYLYYDSDVLYRNYYYKSCGFSARLVMD